MNAPDRSAKVAAWINSHRDLFNAPEGADADTWRRTKVLPWLIRYVNEHDGGRWGYLLKQDRQPPHIPHDIIMWKDTLEHFDVFTGTDRAQDTKPAWRRNGAPANPKWIWLAVDETTGPTPTPVPDEHEPSEFDALVERVDKIEAFARERIQATQEAYNKALARLEKLEQAPTPIPLPDQEYIAEGITNSTGGRFFGHHHAFSVRVRKRILS